jgi:hypothetical protein
MEGRRWAIVDSVLGAALERAPEEREAFVRQACADDAELRRAVESLLAHIRGADHFLEPPARQLLEVTSPSAHDSLPTADDLKSVLVTCVAAVGRWIGDRSRCTRADRVEEPTVATVPSADASFMSRQTIGEFWRLSHPGNLAG